MTRNTELLIEKKYVHLVHQILGIEGEDDDDPIPGYTLDNLKDDLAGELCEPEITGRYMTMETPLEFLRSRMVNYGVAHLKSVEIVDRRIREAIDNRRVIKRR